MNNLIEITVDGRKYIANADQTILQVCREHGIEIPTLCYHPKLNPIGACRLCLVEIEPGNRLVASCLTKVLNHMVVTTQSPRITHSRKVNLELLLARHTMDCLVCDKGGECELQDVCFKVEASGRFRESQNRLTEIFGLKPRDVELNDTRTIIERDLNKCILCKRCVHVCHEVQGAGAIQLARRGMHTELATFYGRELDCEFCGQCVDVCPVGALTHKLSKYRALKWQLEKTPSICPYCSVGCSLTLGTKDNKIVKVLTVNGNGVNQGNLCYKGRYGQVHVNDPQRLTKPLVKDKSTGELKEASWDEALAEAAKRLSGIKAKYGADAIGGIGSVRCTNEANYMFQKFLRAAVGTNNVDNCTRLEHTPGLAVLEDSLGWGAMTNSIGDLGQAEVILMLGCNPVETHPVLGAQIRRQALQGISQLILVEPRKIKLTHQSKLWLPARPGTDLALINGMMQAIMSRKRHHREFIQLHTQGFDDLKRELAPYTPEYVSRETGLSAKQIIQAAELYAGAKSACIIYGTGVTQHVNGTDLVSALADLALLTGNIGKPGSGIIPLRGQNNSQGACDMGVLPDYYPGYQAVSNPNVRQKFEAAWGVKLPDKTGFTLNRMIAESGDKRLRGLYVMGENPALAYPGQLRSRRWLEGLDFLMVQDIFLTDTARLADVVLPADAFAEGWGTFTNTERRVQLLRPAVSSAAPCLPSWEILARLSNRFGLPKNYSHAEQVLQEMAQLTPIYEGINYRRLQTNGIQWPCPHETHPGTPILYQDEFSDNKAKFKFAQYNPHSRPTSQEYPYLLITGEWISHYYTWLLAQSAENPIGVPKQGQVDVNPGDAGHLGISQGQAVTVNSDMGEIVLKANITDSAPAGMLYVPAHFSEAEAITLFGNRLDAMAPIPELKMYPVNLRAV